MTIIKSGIINGIEYTGYVTPDGMKYMASLIMTGGDGFAEHYTKLCLNFDEAAAFIHETWSELEKVK